MSHITNLHRILLNKTRQFVSENMGIAVHIIHIHFLEQEQLDQHIFSSSLARAHNQPPLFHPDYNRDLHAARRASDLLSFSSFKMKINSLPNEFCLYIYTQVYVYMGSNVAVANGKGGKLNDFPLIVIIIAPINGRISCDCDHVSTNYFLIAHSLHTHTNHG